MRVEETVFLEASDAAHALGLTAGSIRLLADAGKLRVAARTPRGLRLFSPEDVATLRHERVAKLQGILARLRAEAA